MVRLSLLNGLRAGALAIALTGLGQTVSATENQSIVLERSAQKWPLTTVHINGIETQALVDTGATVALIDQAFLDRGEAQTGPFGETSVLGIGGRRVYPLHTLSQVRAGPHIWQDVRAAVTPERVDLAPYNVLPTSMFEGDIVDFDFAKRRLRIYSGTPRRISNARRNRIDFVAQDGLIFIPIKINGVRGQALIDTGAEASFVNRSFARQSGAEMNRDMAKLIEGSDQEKQLAVPYKFRDLRFGSAQIDRFQIPVLDSRLFDELGYGDAPMMVMGMDLLSRFRLQIDRKRQRVTFLSRELDREDLFARPSISRARDSIDP